MSDLSQVVVSSGFVEWHARNVARHYGMVFDNTRERKPYRYIIGGANIAGQWMGTKATVVHWVGTDVLHTAKPVGGVHHWCVAENLRAELRQKGVDARVVRWPPLHWFDEPIPRGDRILVYCPPHRHDFFYHDTLREIERRVGQPFIWVPPNARPETWERLDDVFPKVGTYIRLVKHDGWSNTASEMMMAGRVVITNQDRPLQHRVEPTVEAVLEALDVAKPDPRAPEVYRDLCSKRHAIDGWKEILDATSA